MGYMSSGNAIYNGHMDEADDDDSLNEAIIDLQRNLKSMQKALDINQLQSDINYLNLLAKEFYVKGEKE